MKKTILFTFVAIAAIITACSKSDDNPTPNPVNPTPTTGSLVMHFHPSWGTSDFDLDSTYTLASTVAGVPDRQIKFETAKMYVSGINLDNTANDSYLLVTPENMMYNAGNIAPGSFSNVSFNVGLDSATNHEDPTTASAPLNEMGMHWNWNTSAGYKFVRLEGQIDSSATGTAGEWKSFIYHVATDPMLRNVSYAKNSTIALGQTYTYNFHVMWNRFFDGLDVVNNPSNHGGGTTNTTIVNNAQSVFMLMP